MTDYTFADIVAFAQASTRSAGKCLGFANNDVVGHFGTLGSLPYSAKSAADQLAGAGQLHTDACPDYPHVDFYDFGSLGHVDWHFPQHGVHVADSSRTTQKLNANRTVGLYANWGPRRGWAAVPALGAQVSFVNDPTPPPAPAPASGGASTPVGSGWAFNAPDPGTQRRIQVALKNRGRYSGVADGVWGPNSIKGIQLTAKNVGYTGPIDGVPGPETCHYVQVYAKDFGSYTGPVDSILGPNSWAGFALGLERP